MADNLPLTTPPIVADPTIEAQGILSMPSSVGDVFTGDLAANPTPSILRSLSRDAATSGFDPLSGQPLPIEPNVPAAELNDKFAIPARPDGSGGLSFTNDLPLSVGQSMYDAKRAELMREATLARRPSGFFSGAATIASQFAAGALDPVNVAAAFIPVVGEARYAAWLADAGSALGRAGIRAGVGAAQGVVGTAPVVGLQYMLGKQEQSDMSAGDALLDIAFGGVLGGGLHAGAGALADALHGPFRSAPARVASGVDAAATAISEAPLSTREAVLRTSLAQLVEGRPVEVAPIFSADALGGTTRTLADLGSEDQAMLAEPATNPGLQRDLEILRGNQAQPAPAQSFMAALRSFGPIKDDQGELSSLGITSKTNPGLISKTGRSLDEVTLDMHEAGWLGTPGGERPAISDLLSAIYDEAHGQARIHPSDTASTEYAASLRELDHTLYDRGISLSDMSNRDVERALAGEAVDRGPATPADHAAQDAAFAAIQRERFDTAANFAGGAPLPEDAAVSRAADVAEKGAKVSTETAAAQIEAEVKELQASVLAQIAGGEPVDLTELGAAQAEVDRAQAAVSGYRAAAACLASAGA